MKKLFIILGNGFTLDFLGKYNMFEQVNINVNNLFRNGDEFSFPNDKGMGFLSYKFCPALWTLGARPHSTNLESNYLIEEIITCSNMFFDFISDPNQRSKRLGLIEQEKQSIHIKAYSELTIYLKFLFSYYNDMIKKDKLNEFVKTSDWGWISFFIDLKDKIDTYEDITIVTYNYDIWLERILNSLGINYFIDGLQDRVEQAVRIIKPHGSISFIVDGDTSSLYKVNYKLDLDGLQLSDLNVNEDTFSNCHKSIIIPPAGDSARMMPATWATTLRGNANTIAKDIDENDKVVICGMSYWHVDRRELDELLINIDSSSNIYFINPSPPRDLNAVLVSLFENYRLLTTSDRIGDVLNG